MIASRKIRNIIVAVVGLMLGAGAWWYFFSEPPVPRASGKLAQEVYVWQRHWDASVAEAIRQATPEVSRFTVLAAEVAWQKDSPKVTQVEVDCELLCSLEKPVGFALRIGPYSGSYDAENENAKLLKKLARSIVEKANRAGIKSFELQVDFDCAESKLGGYCQWVEALRKAINPTPFSITALPSWLKRKEFARLARLSGDFILQVHSLERPANFSQALVLCDAKKARAWVESAAKIGVPFRVALPTYGYLAMFDASGKFLALHAEGESRSWGKNITVKAVRSNAGEMSALVGDWLSDRPAAMTGITWFRLPVRGDRLNWSWTTLAVAMKGRAPRESLSLRVEYPQPELAELVLVNDGEADAIPPQKVSLVWSDSQPLASDGINGFRISEMSASGGTLERGERGTTEVVSPGDSWKIGWVRFTKKTDVKINVAKP